jgi:hypothetical protein
LSLLSRITACALFGAGLLPGKNLQKMILMVFDKDWPHALAEQKL